MIINQLYKQLIIVWQQVAMVTQGPLSVWQPVKQLVSSAVEIFSLNPNRSNSYQCFYYKTRGTWWRLGWDDDFQPEGRGFDSRSSRHAGIRAVVGSTSE